MQTKFNRHTRCTRRRCAVYMERLDGPYAADAMAGASEFYNEMYRLYLHHRTQNKMPRVAAWAQWVQWQALFWLQVSFYVSALVFLFLNWNHLSGTVLHAHSLSRSADMAVLNTLDGFSEATPEQRSSAVKTGMAVGNIVQDFDSMGIVESAGIGIRSVSTGMAQGDYDDGVSSAFGLLSATFMGFKNGDLARFYGDALDTRSMVNTTLNRADGYAREFLQSNTTVAEVVKGADVPGAIQNVSLAAGAIGNVLGNPGISDGLDMVSKTTHKMRQNGADTILGANILRMTESAATIGEQLATNSTVTQTRTLVGAFDELRKEIAEARYMMTTLFEALRQFQPRDGRNAETLFNSHKT